MKDLKLWIMVLAFVCMSSVQVLAQVVENGKMVTFDYNLFVEDELIESSEDSGPLEYEHGGDQIIPGLEAALTGMAIGDAKTVLVSPQDAYGEIDEQAIREIPKSDLPEGGPEPQVGMLLELISPEGEGFPVIIAEVKDETVLLDFNHPLAGQELKFEVSITGIE